MTSLVTATLSRAGRVRDPGVTLDALNVLLADVRGAFGPYLNVFLVTQQHWGQAEVGWVTAVGGWIALALQTPVGAAIDRSRGKRGILILALTVLAVAALVIWAAPQFWPVMIANSLMAITGDVFGPAVASLTLGLVGRQGLARRLGRNAACDHAGNIAIALIAGAVGWAFGQRSVFLLAPLFAVAAVAVAGALPPPAADAPGRDKASAPAADPAGTVARPWTVLLTCRPLLALCLCAGLFHFANAPLLPLVGQKLAQANGAWATALMSACIVAAQGVMLPVALLAGRRADRWGRKPLLLAGFIILPLRAALYPLSDDAGWLIGVQLLDGVGAGLWSALIPLILADLMGGTGRYNLAFGAVATAQGLGAATSGLVTGVVIDRFGYNAAFLGLAGVALVALAALVVALPETAPPQPPGDAAIRPGHA